MCESRPRVFVSSVMQDYAHFRDAAAEGIRQAGCDPVRAEDFPAAHTSPRTACLDGVRSADAVVLLLGERYGFVGPSGLSATEEEYREARVTHKPILVFLEDTDSCEAREEAFLQQVQDYVSGHWRKTFSEADELTSLVREAVGAADLAKSQGQEDLMQARIEKALTRRPEQCQGVVWLHAIWTMPRNEEVIDPLDLGSDEFQRRVQRLAHECEPPLFSYEESKRSAVAASYLRIEQGQRDNWREGRQLAALELSADGTVSVAQNVTGTETRSSVGDGLFNMYFIDPDVVRARLQRAWAFAAAWWQGIDPYLRHEPLHAAVALHDVGARNFAPIPEQTGRGITVPPECPTNPLIVFDRPRTVARADCERPNEEIERTIKMLERRFQERKSGW